MSPFLMYNVISTKTKHERISLLMDIILYLLQYINYQRKIIGQLLNFICNTYLSNSGPLTTHIPQNTRDIRSTSFHASFLFNRNGTGKILSHTIRNATTKRFARYSDGLPAISLPPAAARLAMLL